MTAGLPRAARAFSRLIPAGDRESILGDLVEQADYHDFGGARRTYWLTAECAAIAAGLSVQRVRGWFVVPPLRELVSGFAVDGRGILRGDPVSAALRMLAFCGSVATLALGVEVLVRTLMTAAGF
jgi:hypothetical protein